ncbi:MAG TPA: radical SAM protein [Myxococcota bacterium]|nr:radical SAM protein [Myxococcota bacterium]
MARLRIKEIFRSVQGESTWAGWPCTFVRTVGCELRCVYCDEPHAFEGGESLEIEDILERVAELGVPLVELTGGEPLQQRALPALVKRLCDAGYQVLIETGGHRDISQVDPRARVILDVKTPGSGMLERNDWQNLARLRPGDEIKLVLCDRADYEWARALIRARDLPARDLPARAVVNLSPVHGALDPQDLVAWVLEDGLRVRVNLQLHKYIWGPDVRGV